LPSTPNPRSLTIKFKGLSDRIITNLSISNAFDPTKPPTPQPHFFETTALWDTGASKSVITKATANSLDLTPTGEIQLQHAGGSDLVNTYVVNFFLPNKVGIAGIVVCECKDLSNNVGAIIGMDIIRMGDFSITNVNKQTMMSYRFPSIESIDYVDYANKLKFAGVGNNDPCPCGKKNTIGKPIKFKKCCKP
jgi:hypothetical protein